MTIPVWVLLFFAFWTLLTLVGSVGGYRLGKIFTGRARARDFSFPDLEQSDWHRRATRAHLNCVENLPVFAAIVVAMIASGVRSPTLDRLAVAFLVARILHTTAQLAFRQTGRVTTVRFGLFTIQLICMFSMGLYIVLHAGA